MTMARFENVNTCVNIYKTLYYTQWSFPRRRSPITESTREVLFLFDWCFCAWLPPSLCLRDPRASLGDCEDRNCSRPLQRESGRECCHTFLRGLSPCGDYTPSLYYVQCTRSQTLIGLVVPTRWTRHMELISRGMMDN